MPYLGLLRPELLPLQQSPADPYPTEDTQTQLCLSLCGVSGFWWTQGLFEPSEHLWQVWGLILNVISRFCPSYHFAGASPLPFDLGYLLKVTPVRLSSLTPP